MAYLDNLNEKFFNPLCGKNREIYFECITQLIEKSKEIATLYETDAKDCLSMYLQNCQYTIQSENIGEEINSEQAPQKTAASILRYFRICGWISPQEVGRSGDNIASVSAYCRKFIESLHKMLNTDGNSAISNHIFAIYEILKSTLDKKNNRLQRPYVNILEPLIEHKNELRNELLILKDSIQEIMRSVIRKTDANSFGQYLIKDNFLEKFFADYFFIKKNGFIPSYIANINQLLTGLRHSEVKEKMVIDYMKHKGLIDEDKTAVDDKINRYFDELESYINFEYEREMGYIDEKINNYYNLFVKRMAMVMNNGINLENRLNSLLLLLKEVDEESKKIILEKIANTHRLMSIKYIGQKSIERRKKVRPNTKTAGIITEELSREEKERLTKELLTEAPDKYSLKNVKEYFDKIAVDKKMFSIEECRVHTREAAMMVAASMIYSGTKGFPYEVQFKFGMVETAVATISKINIIRKNKQEKGDKNDE